MSDILKGIRNIRTFEVSNDGFHSENEKTKSVLDEKMDFSFDGNEFKSIRQALTYSKAKFFGDKENTNLSLKEKDPEKLQEIEGTIKNVNNGKWDQAKSRIAYSVLSEGVQESAKMELSVKNGLKTGEMFIDKMSEKLNDDIKKDNVTKMSLNKITKRFNRSASLEI